jgi:mRNA interferase RelE/StbE
MKYKVYVLPGAWKEIKRLPGNMRQRVKRAIDGLGEDPRPPGSVALDMTGLPEKATEVELRRLRIERWRIVYAITERDLYVDVLAVRKRPPYDYGDLERLLAELQ